jgi:hypothetical protein
VFTGVFCTVVASKLCFIQVYRTYICIQRGVSVSESNEPAIFERRPVTFLAWILTNLTLVFHGFPHCLKEHFGTVLAINGLMLTVTLLPYLHRVRSCAL